MAKPQLEMLRATAYYSITIFFIRDAGFKKFVRAPALLLKLCYYLFQYEPTSSNIARKKIDTLNQMRCSVFARPRTSELRNLWLG